LELVELAWAQVRSQLLAMDRTASSLQSPQVLAVAVVATTTMSAPLLGVLMVVRVVALGHGLLRAESKALELLIRVLMVVCLLLDLAITQKSQVVVVVLRQ
jgi:hypothetical protein